MSAGGALTAAVVGLGVGEQHARAWARAPGCALRWVYDLDAGRMERVAAEVGGAPARGYEQILADPELDVVSIATFDDLHFGQALAALRAGKHVFCEKPLCRSLDEARALKAAWAASDRRHLACNLVLRAAPLWRWLREAIAAGELGQVYAFDGDYLFGRLAKITEGWRKDVPDYSVMQGGAVHLVDLMLWLTGERPRGVHAAGNRISTAGTAFRYHDFVAATYTFASGMVGRVTANFGAVHRHQHVVRVFGTKATFAYDDRGPRLHRSRDPEVAAEALDLAPKPASKGELIAPFAAAISGARRSESELQHELDVIAVCVAADRALATGRVEEVEYA